MVAEVPAELNTNSEASNEPPSSLESVPRELTKHESNQPQRGIFSRIFKSGSNDPNPGNDVHPKVTSGEMELLPAEVSGQLSILAK